MDTQDAAPRPALPFRRVAVLGLGLIGGSVALALARRGLATTITGYDPLAQAREGALSCGAITAQASTAAEAVVHAEIVVVAAPPCTVAEVLREIGPVVRPDAVITDVASTKREIVAAAERTLPHPHRFVGSHPMAGRQQTGISAADPDLFVAAEWCLTPTERTAPDALARVTALVRALGASPRVLRAEAHDRLVAGISHLPLVAAAALVQATSASAEWSAAATLAAGGYRDTTRLAAGSPQMGRDILLSNRDEVLSTLDSYLLALADLRALLAARDGNALAEYLRAAQSTRLGWEAERQSPKRGQ